MTVYRLHASLGGALVDGIPVPDGVQVDIDGVKHTLPAGLVERIRPAEPPQREDGLAFVAVQDQDTGECHVFHRDDVGDLLPDLPRSGPGTWFWLSRAQWVTWDQVCDLGTPIVLVPKFGQSARGTCSVCGKEKPLRADGRVRLHDRSGRNGGRGCDGSGLMPITRSTT